MRLPRDVSGTELAKALSAFGYSIIRQTGSHMRLVSSRNGEHHVTIPQHDPLRVGTLASFLDAVAGHLGLARDEVVSKLFG